MRKVLNHVWQNANHRAKICAGAGRMGGMSETSSLSKGGGLKGKLAGMLLALLTAVLAVLIAYPLTGDVNDGGLTGAVAGISAAGLLGRRLESWKSTRSRPTSGSSSSTRSRRPSSCAISAFIPRELSPSWRCSWQFTLPWP